MAIKVPTPRAPSLPVRTELPTSEIAQPATLPVSTPISLPTNQPVDHLAKDGPRRESSVDSTRWAPPAPRIQGEPLRTAMNQHAGRYKSLGIYDDRIRHALNKSPEALDGLTAPEVAQVLGALIDGPTSQADEKAIAKVVTALGPDSPRLHATMYELARLRVDLPDKLIRDVADRSPLEKIRGVKIDPEAAAMWSTLCAGEPAPGDPKQMVIELRKAALAAGSRRHPEVQVYLNDKLQREFGTIKVGGQEIDRLMEKPEETWQGSTSFKAYSMLYAGTYKSDFADKLVEVVGLKNIESPEEVQRALTSPLVKDAEGNDKQIGDVSIMVNGWFNFWPSAPSVFRLARYTRGPVILANSNPNGANGYKLRPVEGELLGHKIPPELEGKIWTIGEMKPNLVAWPQASDILLEHMEVIQRDFKMLQNSNPSLKDFDGLADAEVAMLGHSQGGPAVVGARDRLAKAGMGDLVDRAVMVNSPFAGGTILADTIDDAADVESGIPTPLGRAAANFARDAVGALTYPDGRRSFEMNDPDFIATMKETQGWDLKEMVDLSYTSRVGPLSYDRKNNKNEPMFAISRRLSSDKRHADGNFETDGMIPNEGSAGGKKAVVDDEPKGHLLSWEDMDTIDAIMENLD